MDHELKVWIEYARPMMSGEKNFDVRYEDGRRFQVGDTISYRETSRALGDYTGTVFHRVITYVYRGWEDDAPVKFGDFWRGTALPSQPVVLGLAEQPYTSEMDVEDAARAAELSRA